MGHSTKILKIICLCKSNEWKNPSKACQEIHLSVDKVTEKETNEV